MEHNRRLISCQRKIRAFRANFEKMLAVVQFNTVQVMTAGNFRILDVLEGHVLEILCMDVSQITKAVVSYSPGLLLIHAPVKSEGAFMSDHVISLGALKWQEYWRQELKFNVRNLSISQIGDFFSMSGDGFMTVCVRDTPTDFTYSQFVYHSRNETKGVIASVIHQDPNMGSVMQQEITNDGRLIVYLEEKSKTVKIIYQDKFLENESREKEDRNRGEYRDNYNYRGYGGNAYRGYGRPKEDRVEVQLEYNPYANEEAAAANPFEMQTNKVDLKYQTDPVSVYSLPEHQNTIEYFKIMHHDLFECEKRYLSNIIITITSKNEVFFWLENLTNSEMQFNCIHTIRSYPKAEFFDASFLDFPPINPKRYVEMKASVSRLFDSNSDKNLQIKKDEENTLSIFKPNYAETSIDWILILNDQIIDIYKAEGLRNFPYRNVQIGIWNRYKLGYTPRDFYGSCKIVSASCRDFNDVISLYTLNTNGQMIKLRKDFKEQGQGKWKVDKVAILKRQFIEDIIVHKHLPLIAHLMNKTELYFFIEEKTKNRLVKESLTGGSMRFLGAYSIFHSHSSKAPAPLQIVRAKWVDSPLCMMIVQFTNDTLALVSSQTQLRILSHTKFQEDYLKLWETGDKGLVTQVNEKWEKIYEIHFNQGKSVEDHHIGEHLVDFEIIQSQITDEGNGFKINLAVFTSFNQYLVYETHTSLLAGMKSLSKTKLLYHVYTADCVLSLLSAVHFQSEWSNSMRRSQTISSKGNSHRVVMALMTEIDPNRQRIVPKVEQPKKEIVSSNPYDFGDDDKISEESDDGDIFGQYSFGQKKENLLKKKPAPQVEIKQEVQKPAELKPMVLIKLVQFNDECTIKKEAQELWKVELPTQFKTKMLKCRASEQFFAFMTSETITNKESLIVYLYDMMQNKYLGYINLNSIIGLDFLDVNQIDFIFSSASSKGSLTIYHQDTLYLVAESSREGLKGKWTLVKKFDKVLKLGDQLKIEHITIKESFLRKQVLVVNKKILSVREKFTLKESKEVVNEEGEKVVETALIKLGLHNIYSNAQKSFPIYHPKVLKRLFLKGYITLVLKILLQLNKSLDLTQSQTTAVSEFLEFDLKQIMTEVNEHISTQLSSQQNGQKKKQETASSIFDDFMGGGGNDDGDIFSMGHKSKKKQENSANKQLETEFEEVFSGLVQKVKKIGEKALGLKEEKYRLMFIDFLKRFKQLYKKEFFSDSLTSILLREIFFDTEDIQKEDEEKQQEMSKQFNVADYISQIRAQPAASLKGSITNLQQWNSLQTCLALHSEAQDVLLNEIQERFDFDSNLTYELMKKLCVPIWLKDVFKLKNLVTIIAKNEYKIAGDDFGKESRAEKTALWYIILDKKDQLARLYKQEPQNKKVYELLLNDFTLPKWKSTAEKNAMVLMSKKRYMLASAFFVLAGNIKDAISVALDKMNDCVLALLMSRIYENQRQMSGEEQKEELQSEKIYQTQFIERGIRFDDPYLQNIGYWQRKEYVKAVNAFHIEPQQVNTLTGLFLLNSNLKEQNLFPISEISQNIDKTQQLLIEAAKVSNQEYQSVPVAIAYEYTALDIVKQLKKSTIMKIALQQSALQPTKLKSKFASNYDDDDGGSIFDDFFGGATAKPKKTDEEKQKELEQEQKKKEETTLKVDEAKILEYVTLRASQTGYSLQAIVMMTENSEHVEKQGTLSKQIIGLTLLSDYVNSPAFQYQSIQKLKASASLVVEKLELDANQVRTFILRQFKYNESFLMNVNYIVEDDTLTEQQQKQEGLSSVEEQALKMADFVLSIADYPFSLVHDGKSQDSVKYTIKKAVSYLESLAEAYIIVDMQTQSINQKLNFSEQQRLSSEKLSPLNKNLGFQSKISMTIGDLQNDEGNYEFTVEEDKGNLKVKNLDINKTKQTVAGVKITDDLEQILSDVGAKTRILMVLYLGLIQVCIITRKYFLIKELLQDLKQIFTNNYLNHDKEGQQQVGILMQKMKTQIQKIKYSLNQKVNEEQKDDFEAKLRSEKPKTKEELESDLKKFKINSFINLWFQYITNHYVENIMRQSYQNGQIRGLIDIRPSIVGNLPMNIVVEHILNPRLQATDLMKRFVNMDRVLENVTTYYFENFLNLSERTIVSQDLQAIFANRYDANAAQVINPIELFGSDRRFADYAELIELKTFIKHLRDHELSLVYHRNHDYSARAVERTQQIYENGIDIFRMKTETVGGFAFDHCDLDLVAFALQSKGIREIPVKKSLLYRNRSNKGHQVVDEELGSWHECLNRFNKIQNDHQDIRPTSEAVIGAVERLYQYKTINYAKKQRRNRNTFFLDYELNPPEIWSAQNYQEYLHHRGEFEVTHEVHTNAIESHPYLPLYVSGDARGLLCLWEFNQKDDLSLDQWITEPGDFKNYDPKKSMIKKISFNGYGDKLYSSNFEGLITVFNFDDQESSRSVPIYTLKRGKEDKVSDFEILNQDTVFAVTSPKPKHTWIYDILMPSRNGLITEIPIGGSVIQPFRSKSQIMLFNVDKPGTIVLYDLKMNKPVFQTNLHQEEVTSVAVTESETTLVAGFRDGYIKIFNMDKEFDLRESYQAFSSAGNKKGGVSQVRIHPTNGALFASSTIGNLKLFRTRV